MKHLITPPRSPHGSLLDLDLPSFSEDRILKLASKRVSNAQTLRVLLRSFTGSPRFYTAGL